MLRKLICFLCYLISFLLVFYSFPKYSLSFLAFFSLVPSLLIIIHCKTFLSFIKQISIFSLLVNFSLIYWIVPTFNMAGIPFFISVIAAFLLAFYLSIYWNIFFIAVFLLKNNYFKLYNIIFLSCIWVLLEYARTYVFTGFPWNLLGYSQWNNLMIIQISDITSVYGVSFFIIFINIYLTYMIDLFIFSKFFNTLTYFFCVFKKIKISYFKNSIKKKDLYCSTIFLFLLIVFVCSYGLYRLHFFNINKYSKDRMKISVLQGNIDQYKKFDFQYFEYIRGTYKNLINLNKNVDVFVWPETAYPFIFSKNINYFLNGVNVQSNHIIGSFYKFDNKLYNAAIFLDCDLNVIDYYSKIHLVPFGEYFPFQQYLKKIFNNLDSLGGVNYGHNYTLFKLKNNLFSVNICFESLFPNLVRQFVIRGSNILFNISNDGWYLNTSAPYQHFSFNIFRAIENRRYLIRAANTGISAVVDPFGRIKIKTFIYHKSSFISELKGLDYLSFYSKYGDVFILICFVYVCFLLFQNYKFYRKLL